jgi:hypothetical protein
VQPEKLSLLFGKSELPDSVDLDREDGTIEYIRQTSILPMDDLEVALRAVLARQILDENPPLVWETARRLLGLGRERHEVLEQLSRALSPIIEAAVQGETDGYEERYESLLRALPLRTEEDIRSAIRSVLMVESLPSLDNLSSGVLAELYDVDLEQPDEEPIDDVIDQMIQNGELELVAGDVVVDPAQLCVEAVLTTRVVDGVWPPVQTDFAGLAAVTDDFDDIPAGAEPGQLVVGRIRNGRATVELVELVDTPPLREGVVAAIREAYDAESAEAGLPLTFREVILRMLYDDLFAFETAQLPLQELVAAAGLEIRDDLISDGEEPWRRLAHSRAAFRIADLFADDEERRQDALAVCGLFERVDLGDEQQPVTAAELRLALDAMADDDVFTVVTDQFFGYDENPKSFDAAEVFARRLTLAASKPLQRAVANVVNAKVEERRCNPLAAADALAEAVREAPDFFQAVDRLAWTRADQGRASEARALWARLGMDDGRDVEAIDAAMAGQPEHGNVRRNDPCWCGSGRKYKACHLHSLELPPLPGRFSWLLRKSVAYLDRRGAPMDDVIFGAALQLAGGDPDRLTEVIGEPLLLDVVLHELGWLVRFLAERGPLLPDDERGLVSSWQAIARTVYEITDVRAGDSMTLRDVRTDNVTRVVERTASTAATIGQMICARAVPDGRGHQLVGSVISVSKAYLPQFLEILDEPDPAVTAQRLLDLMAESDGVFELSLSRALQERGVAP